MCKISGPCLAIPLLLLIGGISLEAGAQEKAPAEKPFAPRIRQTKIQEIELDSTNPDPPAQRRELRETVRSHEGAPKTDVRVTDKGPGEMENDALRERTREADSLPLLARITPKTSPQRAASLKLVAEGREALVAGEYKRALSIFERAIAVDATNPYSHYFLARAHFFLGNYPASFNFLDVAESLLGWHKRWLAEIYVLKGRNATAMGFLGRADTNYMRALAFDPHHRFAFERLTSIERMTDFATAPGP